ncbi:MAG: nucleotidyl transferase AbiEii/AbiGii toxin family protein [Candidatus Aminicenantes bacterium]|nr:nucleotidyl transferase AbiEii/AbiGii toxin family protein [Candidatus Aminicenantes bacterium]
MTKTSLDLSGRIEQSTIDLLQSVQIVASELSVDYFLIGATARDFLLEKAYGISTFRATLDYDLGIQLEDWELFEDLKAALIRTSHFTATREMQRLVHRDGAFFDLIPFGPIGGRESIIKWPPDQSIEMDIAGFEESYQSAVNVILQKSPLVEVKAISLAGLVVLKLFSWNEKRHERNKDASDLALIIRKYADAGNSERIVAEFPDFLEQEDFDYIAAGARLLGKDIRYSFGKESKKKILTILHEETGEQEQYRLIEDMIQTRAISGNDFAEMKKLMEEVILGIRGN